MGIIEKAAVIGAGVMGSGIAAHLANAGVAVVLMDVVPEGAENRNVVAESALRQLLRSDPPAFMHRRAANLLTPANVVDHLDLLGTVDWIIEAVTEDLEAKRALYSRVDKYRRDGSIVSSNTSALTLGRLVEGMGERFCRDFIITHFFNPPRYLRLMEMVAGPKTRPEAVGAIQDFADRRLGKHVVFPHDSPGFIANRVGAFWLRCAIGEAIDRGLSVEEADSLMCLCFGVPKTGVFGLLDLIGLDLILEVDAGLAAALPASDPYRQIRRDIPLLSRMIREGYTGRKGRGGFYRLGDKDGAGAKEAIDLASGDYRPAARPLLDSLKAGRAAGLPALLEHRDRGGGYAWAVLSQTLAYVASVAPEIADQIYVVDQVMRLGYSWDGGPFELIDRLGPGYLAGRLGSEDREVPPLIRTATEAGGFYRVMQGHLQYLTRSERYAELVRGDGVLMLSDIKLASRPLAHNRSASLWDVGDGVACLEIHTKMNSIDPDVFTMIGQALEIVRRRYRSLVIYNEAQHFSAGVNLGFALFAANIAAWPMMADLLRQGQELYQALKHSPFPVVAAPSGLALGGGCELLLHCDAVQAHAESYMGLVETAVGLVPAWGGCKELLARLSAHPRCPRGPMAPVAAAFETIGLARVAKSAFEAQELGFLRPTDGITFNRDRLLADAKAKAIELAENYHPPKAIELTLPGPSGKAALCLKLRELRAAGEATEHDQVVAEALAEVLTGGPEADPTRPVQEGDLLALERAAFVRLVRYEATLARMEHMLETGKPLRN